MYSYREACARGTFVRPPCLSADRIVGKSWAGALISDEDPEDRWRRQETTIMRRDFAGRTKVRWAE